MVSALQKGAQVMNQGDWVEGESQGWWKDLFPAEHSCYLGRRAQRGA